MKAKQFFKNFGIGAAIGVSIITPGVSGGTIAVLFKVYDQIIDAVSNLRREFKKNIIFLLPLILGAICGLAALYFPLKLALEVAPLPTVLLFTGLMIGSFPKIFKDAHKNGIKKIDSVAIILPLALVVGICFIPGLGKADLTTSMPVYGYFLLFLIGALASCALVIPGISGSMLLLILGYYDSILETVSALKTSAGHSVLVLAIVAIGILVGFFSIAKLMKLVLAKFPRATYWASIGFIIGSIPAPFITFGTNFPEAPAI
ncbi:MAG: DUF368 domain-containing protein, partial [Clostridia bacterium]|nr:DUF368 domain-containing protein [Clostridia bacterium]